MAATKIVKIDPLNPKYEYLREAADILKKGGLVIIPTETVYGIAADSSNKKAIKKLYAIKKRPKAKPFSLLIDTKEKIEDFAKDIPISAYKLIDKFWPGPLTLILKSKDKGNVGIRMPNNEIALKIITLSRASLACPSANISGEPAPINFQEAIKDLQGHINFAIDAGSTKLGMESSVVDLTVGPLEILREGAIKKEDIEATALKKAVLFVCTGNSCRSVMAEALLKKKLMEKNRQDVEVLSAGIMLLFGLGPTLETKEVLKEEGIDISAYRSQRVTLNLIRKSDLILVMERLQEERILNLLPEAKNRVFLLKEFAKINDSNLDIIDPIGKTKEFYGETLGIIKQAIERVAEVI